MRNLIPRSELRSAAVLTHFPDPVPFSQRSHGGYSLTGAYLLCRGLPEEAVHNEFVAFPSDEQISRQFLLDNRILRATAIGLVDLWGGNPKVLLADLFAEAVRVTEDLGHLREACLLLDAALFLARRDLQTGSRPLRRLELSLVSPAMPPAPF